MKTRCKLVRITTVPISLEKLLENQLKFMSSYYRITAISSNEVELKEIGRNQNINTFCLELSREITLMKDIRSLIKLYKYLKLEKPLIVHTHTPKAGIIGMLASYLAKVPIRIHTVAGLPLMETKGVKRKVLNLVEKLTYRCATRVYPNSKGLEKIILKEKFIKREKLKVLANGSSNGIDTAYFNPELFLKEEKAVLKKKLTISQNDFVFIFVGRIVGDKGINELVKAFDKLSLEQEHIKLLLVGSREQSLDPLKKETNLIVETNEKIITVGYQSDVRPYFSISDALVFPSYREGFPNVVMQAGAMKLPSIVSDINGCNEIIKDGLNGFIIPVKDVTAIFEAMKKLMADYRQNNAFRENSRKMIVDRYNQQEVWNSILNEYKQLENNV